MQAATPTFFSCVLVVLDLPVGDAVTYHLVKLTPESPATCGQNDRPKRGEFIARSGYRSSGLADPVIGFQRGGPRGP
jgi:hypothetical protein